jgi:hypothetical protein
MVQPNYQNFTSKISGFSYTPLSDGTITIYDSITIPSAFFVLNHQAYIYAPQTGVYNFTSYVS